MNQESSKNSTLRRSIALISATLLTISAITPASSMFIIIPGVISQAGTGVIYALLIAAVVGLIMSSVYSELASAYPSAGGEYVIVAKILGLMPSYITLILNASVMALISAVLASGAGDYFSALLPSVPPKITAISIICLATVFGILNIRLNAWITGAFLAIELVCIVSIAVMAGTHVNQPASVLINPTIPHGGVLQPTGMAAILIATATAVFAFNGYEQAVYLTEEIARVRRQIARIIIGSLLLTLVLEFTPTALMLLASRDLNATLTNPSPFQELVIRVEGLKAAKWMSAGISLAVLNACIVNILMTARFLFSTGRDGFWGKTLGRRLSKIEESQGTPWLATFLVGTLSVIGCLFPLNALLVLTGTGLIAIYMMLCIAVIAGRSRNKTPKALYRIPLYPLPPLLGLIALAGISVANWLDPALGRPSIIFTFVEIIFAVALFVAVRYLRTDVPLNIVEPESDDDI